ncbi:MAG: hypothetical protein IJ604_13145 [Prevotella sp.]|nr:hypothetical protein [Prevotella sp.]MBR1880477.1 hypothetical protein [Prevotella sp.]
MAKIKCRLCTYLDYDFFERRFENRTEGNHYCGLHGRAQVDPDGEQVNLDHRGGCGFCSKQKDPVQLTFNFDS